MPKDEFFHRAIAISFVFLACPAGKCPSQAHAQTGAPQPADSGSNPLAMPLRLIDEARQSYQRVKDYTCLFVKREVLNGQLQPENHIVMKVRTQPFSVYMRWLRPSQSAGQEACYVAGRNNGMMRAHSTGLIGKVGFVTIAPDDPRAMQASRHAITEAGIGNLIERLGRGWQLESQLNRTQVQLAEYEYDKKRCTRVETIHSDNAGNQITFYRTVVYFDQATRLPVRIENYDWPRTPGDRAGKLIESYSYADLRFNVGLGEETFNH
jgi:hypothetical protein